MNERQMEIKFNFYRFSLVEIITLVGLLILLSIAIFRTPVAVTYIDEKLQSRELYTSADVEKLVGNIYKTAAEQGYILGGVHALKDGVDSMTVSAPVSLPHRNIRISFLLTEFKDSIVVDSSAILEEE